MILCSRCLFSLQEAQNSPELSRISLTDKYSVISQAAVAQSAEHSALDFKIIPLGLSKRGSHFLHGGSKL